jgi:hypothetical protein
VTGQIVRKLVALPPHVAEAVERFRTSGSIPMVCAACGRRRKTRDGNPTESDALRELIEAGLAAWEEKRS